MVLTDYQLGECLYQGERTEVYRAQRTDTGDRAIVKILRTPHPSFKQLVQFRNQYAIARHLQHPGIVRPIALKRYGNGYALVMPDEGAIPLLDYWQHSEQSIEQFLHIAIQLADALHYLNQQRIIHKDIKPANILIHPETGQIKLIDFSISSLLPKEIQTLQTPNVLEGTLAYLPPEQTGRMNRGIDYRSDFYSLGVTFYQLLAGQLPFQTRDALELIHCHIAQHPLAPGDWLTQKGTPYPSMLSDLVLKLMAKNAEDRYQSALGLKYDLEKCLTQWRETQTIQPFVLGERDRSDRFIIPEQLYGRETEVETLLQAFERVSQGATEMMLVAGFSGIGKTAVVNEVHKPIVRKRGYFIKGKYDQFNRNIPFSAFVQAFRDLMEQLLTESDAKIQQWKAKILTALGENAQVIIEVIPELEKVVGKQPPAVELSGTAAQNRFNLLIQKFTQVFTDAEHPLVMFLDDLQWADLASLKLMQVLMVDTHHLLLIGAYRDNEVHLAHPLMLILSEIKKANYTLNTIRLKPLNQSHIARFVADTLKSPTEVALPFSQLVFQKTTGNPFFATHFLKALQEENFIQFNFDVGCWQCDIDRVKQQALTDDVLEFMTLQLEKLPLPTQNILKFAACIGNQFDLATLAIVSEQSDIDTAAALWKALQEGLILPQSEVYKFYLGQDIQAVPPKDSQTVTYKFLHDRVQQAAYSLIPEREKAKTHYQIGKLLFAQSSSEDREDRIFEMVNQLNYGTDFITQPTERDELVQLNLIACRKAKTATAYQTGREYANIGLSFLRENAWQSQYEITLAFHDLAAEIAMLCGDFEEMERLIEIVINHARSLLEKINVYQLSIQAKTTQSKLTEAIAIGTQLLQELGVTIPKNPTLADIQQLIQEISDPIGNRKIEDFIDLPPIADAKIVAIVQVATSILIAAYSCGSLLFSFLVSLSVKLSLQHGNIAISALNYTYYSLIVCDLLQDVDLAVQFSQLALNLISKLDAKTSKPEVLVVWGAFILHRKSHIKETLTIFNETYTTALEIGNLQFVGHSGQNFCMSSFWCGQPLISVEENARIYCNGLVQVNQLTTANYCRIYWQTVLNLLGYAKHPTMLSGSAFQEKELLPLLLSTNDLFGLYIFYLHKLTLSFLFGKVEEANTYAVEARKYLMAATGTVGVPALYFYDSLTVLMQLTQMSEDGSTALERVADNQVHLQRWAQNAPMNYQHKFELVEAEKYRILGNKVQAIECYDRAIQLAKENEYIQEEALANELAAKFYLNWGKTRLSGEYMTEAYYCYARWGAKAKVSDLEKRYPRLLASGLRQTGSFLSSTETISDLGTISSTVSPTSSSSVSVALDLAAILKANQTLSSEIELDKLLSSLLSIIIENGGADKCVLMLLQDDRLLVQGSIALGSDPVVLQQIPVEESQDIPKKLIYKVKHNLHTELLTDTSTEPTLARDPYIDRHQPQSVLCSPILHQGKLLGILYLENNLTKGAFTRDRVELLNLLCAQAAISLENAQLYERSQEYAQQLERALQNLQNAQLQLVQSEKMSALGNLVSGIGHEMNNPLSFISASLEQAKPVITDVFEHLKLYQETFPYPSEKIVEHGVKIDLDYTLEDFPRMLESMAIACNRLKHISRSLRTFSRADREEKVPFNIHEGIESTVLILKHRLKANEHRPGIEVVTHYSNLPEIHCFPGQLNQVFMNLLANAIDALDESSLGWDLKEIQPRFYQITIQTFLEANQVKISIADNGMGMTESVQKKIFDHLFTTKAVGKGTGLGLAIARQIVEEKHGGKIELNSQRGIGTEFIISLPR